MLLSERLAADQILYTAWSGVPDTLTVELLAAQGFDAVTLDMQHGAHNEESVVRCLQPILAARKHAIVRIPIGRFDVASRALDFGAEAVIAPMVNSAEDARRFAAAMKYPPLGERSWGPTFGLPRKRSTVKEWLGESNRRTMAIAMIETRAAITALDEILATPGIDAIFVGPSDFSIAWSNGAELNPMLDGMMGAVADVAERARAAGKPCAIYLVNAANAKRLSALGYRLFALGSEGQLITLGADGLLSAARASLAGD